MQSIECWNDVTQFAGSVVAYKTDSVYFGATRSYVFENKSLYFGYIEKKTSRWSSGEMGYNMSNLLKADQKAKLCAIILSKITSPISMRLAKNHEIEMISKAVESDEAYFAFIFTKEKMQGLLIPQLSPSKL